MEFEEVVEKRKSVRKYSSKQVEKNKIKKILSVISKTPSAGNLRSFTVEVVTDEKTKHSLAEASYGQEFVATAPVLLVFFADPEKASKRYGERGELFALQDATIAAAYSQLACVDEGLSSCWVGAFDDEKVKKIMKKELRPIAIITVGYPS